MTQSAEQRRLVRLASAYNRKARRLGTVGRVTADQLGWIEQEQPNCHHCGIHLEVGQGTFDHLRSFDSGGQNLWYNIVRCCLTCNRNKFTKSVEEFAEHRDLVVACEVCGKEFQPRWAEYQNGRAKLCSRRCNALKRWQKVEV